MSQTFVPASPGAASYAYLNGATSKAIKSGPGSLQSIVVGVGATGSIVLYDSTSASGNVIADISTTNPGTYLFGCAFINGLYIVQTGSADTTILYS